MKAFFDSSAFSKRFVDEVGSQAVEDICQETSLLGLSVICFPEIISGLNRRLREKCFTRQAYLQVKNRLIAEISDAQVINLSLTVVEHSVVLLESNTLRSLDALHIACALEWEAQLFVSSDKKQIKAAKKAGLKTTYIGND